MIDLDTGTYSPPLSGQTQIGNVVFDKTPSDRVVYPSHAEQLIRVNPNSMIVVTAYGMTSGTPVHIEKVLVSSGTPATSTGGCCPTIQVQEAERMVLNRVRIPNLTLCTQTPYVVLSVPGIYALKVPVDNGDIMVTAVEYTLQQSGPNVNPCCIGCEEPIVPVPNDPLPPPPQLEPVEPSVE